MVLAQINAEQRLSEERLRRRDMLPGWPEQRNRCIVPRKRADTRERLRMGPVTTLGDLFIDFGTAHTARVICAFYRACRLAVLKK